MDNQNLSAFINVAETNSFSEAAFLLDVTQSTISKRIALLESKIGKRLFDRIARQVTLILKEYESALQAINDLSGKTSGVLRLAISHHLGLHRLPPLLKIYAQQHPDVSLDIEFMDSEKAYEQVLNGHSEIAIITLALEHHPNVVSQKVWNDPLHFICAQDHALAGLTSPKLVDIANFPVILPGLNTYTGRIVQKLAQINHVNKLS